MSIKLKPFSWERMIEAVEAVRERLLKATSALQQAEIPYAVAGGHAVAAWVARVDRAAVRNTQDVDILVRRSDFGAVKAVLEEAGFVYRRFEPLRKPNVRPRSGTNSPLSPRAAGERDRVRGFPERLETGIDCFLDHPDSPSRDAVHIVYAAEKVKPGDLAPTADVTQREQAEGYAVLQLESLVRMKLTSYRRKDQVHLIDMITVGLIDSSWPQRYPPALAERLQQLLDDPDG